MPGKPQPGDSPLLPPIPDRPTPFPAKPVKPISQKYANVCTHPKLTRLWDPLGGNRCMICKKPTPNIGWLWRCTTDTDGFLPQSNFEDVPDEKITTTLMPSTTVSDISTFQLSQAVLDFLAEGDYTIEYLNVVPQLKPRMLKAIGEHKYSHDEVKQLIKQKIEVQIAIRETLPRSTHCGREEVSFNYGKSDTRPTTASTAAKDSVNTDSSGFTRGPTLPTSTTFSSRASTATDEEIRQAYDWSELHRMYGHLQPVLHWREDPDRRLPVSVRNLLRYNDLSTPPGPYITEADFALSEIADEFHQRMANEPATHVIPCCNWMVCQTCRPAPFDERTAPKIDNMMNSPPPPAWEIRNRPISDLRYVRSLGLRKPAQLSPSAGVSDAAGSFFANRSNHDKDVYTAGQEEHGQSKETTANELLKEDKKVMPRASTEYAHDAGLASGAQPSEENVVDTIDTSSVNDDVSEEMSEENIGTSNHVLIASAATEELPPFDTPALHTLADAAPTKSVLSNDAGYAEATAQGTHPTMQSFRPHEKRGGFRAKLRHIFQRRRKLRDSSLPTGKNAQKDLDIIPESTAATDSSKTPVDCSSVQEQVSHTSIVGNDSPANTAGRFQVQGGGRDTSCSSLGAAVQAAGDRQA